MLIHKAKSLAFFETSFSDPFTSIEIKAPNSGKIIIADKMGKEFKIYSQFINIKLTNITIPANITIA